jgi:hypothetical protein
MGQGPSFLPSVEMTKPVAWREQIPVLDSHGATGKFAQAAKTFNYSNTQNTKLENHDRKERSAAEPQPKLGISPAKAQRPQRN